MLTSDVADSVPLGMGPGATRLLAAWLADDPGACAFLPPRLCDPERIDCVRLAYARVMDRDRLRTALLAGYARIGMPSSWAQAVERLCSPDGLAVVTGQQPGLLLGPLYTPYKILTAISLAKRLELALHCPVVPVYWCAAEDHDFAEAATVTVHSRLGAPVTLSLPAEDGRSRQLADVPLSACPIERLQRWWEANLPATEFSSTVWELVAQAYAESRFFGEWMIALLRRVLPEETGLVVVDPSWPQWRQMVSETIRREIQEPTRTSQSVRSAALALRERGFNPAMHKADDRCAFFVVQDGVRLPVYYRGTTFFVGNEPVTAKDLADQLSERPERFSSSAALRPVIQDRYLPTVVNVIGPGELGYLAQLGEVYARHGVPRPAAVMRFSATLLEPTVLRFLSKYHLVPMDLFGDPDALRKRIARQSLCAGVGDPLTALREEVERTFRSIEPQALALDSTLAAPIRKLRVQIVDALGKAEDLITRRAAQQAETLARQLASVRDSVMPFGQPQERTYTLISFLNKYGSGLVARLRGQIEVADLERHHFVTL